MASLPQLIEEDISELDRGLNDLLLKAEANNALLIDKGGFLITHCGDPHSCDTTTLAALAAASYAATEGIASLVGEPNFTSVYQQGGIFSLLVENVDENCLLAIVFKAQISVGAVKYFATTTMKQIAKQLKKARKRSPEAAIDLSMLNLADTRPLFSKKTI